MPSQVLGSLELCESIIEAAEDLMAIKPEEDRVPYKVWSKALFELCSKGTLAQAQKLAELMVRPLHITYQAHVLFSGKTYCYSASPHHNICLGSRQAGVCGTYWVPHEGQELLEQSLRWH